MATEDQVNPAGLKAVQQAGCAGCVFRMGTCGDALSATGRNLKAVEKHFGKRCWDDAGYIWVLKEVK